MVEEMKWLKAPGELRTENETEGKEKEYEIVWKLLLNSKRKFGMEENKNWKRGK